MVVSSRNPPQSYGDRSLLPVLREDAFRRDQTCEAAGPTPGTRRLERLRRAAGASPTWLPVVAVCVVYALLSFVANGSSWAHGAAHTLLTSGENDPGEEVWFLAQTPWAMLHGHNPFVNNWLNAPVGLNLMDNTFMPLLGLLFAPVTLLFGPIATFNVVLDAAIFSSATAFFFMARRFVSWWPAAFVGGLLYGFSPFSAAVGNAHLFLLIQAAPPLIILFLDRFLRNPSASPWWTGVAIGACYVAQFYVATEVFASLVVVTLLAAAVAGGYAVARHVPLDFRRLRQMGACTLAVIVLGVGYGAWTALEGPQHVNGSVQSTQAIAERSTDPIGLVAPTSNQRFALRGAELGDVFVAGPIENGSYLGAPLLLVLVIGVRVLRRRPLVLYCGAMAGIALVLSMGSALHLDGYGTGIPLPYAVLAHFPLLNGAIPSRWFCYVWLFAALLLALIVDAAVCGPGRPPWRNAPPKRLRRVRALGRLRAGSPRAGLAVSGGRRAGARVVYGRGPLIAGRFDGCRVPVVQPVELVRHGLAGHGGHALPDAGRLRRLRDADRGDLRLAAQRTPERPGRMLCRRQAHARPGDDEGSAARHWCVGGGRGAHHVRSALRASSSSSAPLARPTGPRACCCGNGSDLTASDPFGCNSGVPGAGLEPARPFGQRLLRPPRLPFRHPGGNARAYKLRSTVKR